MATRMGGSDCAGRDDGVRRNAQRAAARYHGRVKVTITRSMSLILLLVVTLTAFRIGARAQLTLGNMNSARPKMNTSLNMIVFFAIASPAFADQESAIRAYQ